jgi:membrane protein YdbS with pleckstrin-like domain
MLFWLLPVFVGSFGYYTKFWDIIGAIALIAALIAVCFLKIESHSRSKNSN